MKPIRRQHVFTVYVAKWYFPRALWPTGFTEAYHTVQVKAETRGEAARRAWARHGREWLAQMAPMVGRLPRKVSLHVSGTGSVSYAHRMTAVHVYTGQPQAACVEGGAR